MPLSIRTEDKKSPEITISLLAILLTLALGTSGYVFIEGWNAFDAFYMTVITLATIGYGETHTLSTAGRVFTIFLIFLGVGIGTVVLGSVWRTILDTQLTRIMDRRRKVQDKIQHLSGHTIFCGYSRLERVAAEELKRSGHEIVIIEIDEARAQEAFDAGFLIIHGDATQDDCLIAAGITRAARLVSLLPRDSDNMYVILTAREMNPSLYIVSRAEDDVGEKRLKRAGVNRLISTYRLAARKLADGLLRPYVTDFFEVAGQGEEGWKIEEIKIPASSPVCNRSLKELALRQKANVSIAAIISPEGKLHLNPDGESVLLPETTLIAIGWKKDIGVLERIVVGH